MLETKEIIITTSQKLFSRFGLNKTTVDEIAKLAHVAKGTIYHHFQSKEQIFEEVIEKEAIFLYNEIKKNVDNMKSPKEKLRTFVIMRFKHLKNLANYYSALKDDYLSHYAFIEKARKKYFDNELKMVTNILEEGNKNNIFSIQDVKMTSLAIVTALRGLEHPWNIEDSISDIEKSVDSLINVLLKGIEAR